ncbi:MAG: beta-galactosidase [Thermoproteota archaeon]
MKISINRYGFTLNNEKVEFLSGEFHYWRVKIENWDKIMNKLREAGLRIISTYIPWDFHKIGEEFDFEGDTDPQRALNRFIDLVEEKGFLMMVRPGPYIYAEWRYGGVPEEAFRHHRFSEEFRRLASNYIRKVCDKSIVPNQATKGGPIFVLQVDNEVDPWVRYYRDQLGLSRGKGPFKDFLAQKYGRIEALNDAWDSDYESFEEIESYEEHPLARGNREPENLLRYLDYRAFLDWSVEQIISWTREEYRRNGVEIPMLVNTYDDPTFHDLARLSRIVDLPCMDIYLKKHLPKSEVMKLSYWVRAYAAYTVYPIATEFQSGIWTDALYSTGPIDGTHERLLGLSAMAWGLKGWNWYMAVGRDNWTCAPVNEWGLINPDVYQSIQELSKIYRFVKPYNLEKLTSIALVHYRPEMLLRHPSEVFSERWSWGRCFSSLHRAGLDFTFYNPEANREKRPLLLYAGDGLMWSKDAENLLRACYEGCHIIFFRKTPLTDFTRKEIEEFAEIPRPIGSRAEPRGSPMVLQISFKNLRRKIRALSFHFFDQQWDEAITISGAEVKSPYVDTLPVLKEHVVGLTRKNGEGRMTIIGLDPSASLLKFLIDAFNFKLPARTTSPMSFASLHRDAENGSRYVAFTVNTAPYRQIVSTKLNLPSGSFIFRELRTGEKGTIEGGEIELRQLIGPRNAEITEFTEKK